MRKLINTLILIMAILPLFLGIQQCRSVIYPFSKLVAIRGVITQKDKKIILEDQKEKTIMLLKIDSQNTDYSVTFFNPYFDNSVTIGDSVIVFVKDRKDITLKTLIIANQDGSRISSAFSENEILHLIKLPNQEILLDYEKQQKILKNRLWVFPFGSLLFFAWFLWRRSGKKHPLILEN